MLHWHWSGVPRILLRCTTWTWNVWWHRFKLNSSHTIARGGLMAHSYTLDRTIPLITARDSVRQQAAALHSFPRLSHLQFRLFQSSFLLRKLPHLKLWTTAQVRGITCVKACGNAKAQIELLLALFFSATKCLNKAPSLSWGTSFRIKLSLSLAVRRLRSAEAPRAARPGLKGEFEAAQRNS